MIGSMNFLDPHDWLQKTHNRQVGLQDVPVVGHFDNEATSCATFRRPRSGAVSKVTIYPLVIKHGNRQSTIYECFSHSNVHLYSYRGVSIAMFDYRRVVLNMLGCNCIACLLKQIQQKDSSEISKAATARFRSTNHQ